MRPSLSTKLVLAALAALPAWGQVWSVEITAPQTAVVAGRSIQLRARGLNQFGGGVGGFRAAWRSLAPEVAQVSASGQVRGTGIGAAEIEAADPDSGASARVTIKVRPFRVEITPSGPDVRAGESLLLAARALDADLGPLDARFTWVSDQPAIAGVSPDGLVTALAEGSVTIYARLEAPGIFAGASARVNVLRRPDYRLKRLITAGDTRTAETITSIRQASFAANDVYAALVALSGGGQAILARDGGQTRTVAATGQYLDSIGRFISRFAAVSANARGDVAALAEFPAEWCDQAIVLFRKNQPPALASQLGCGFDFGARSLGDDGSVYYRLIENGKFRLWVRPPDGAPRPIVETGGAVPGFTVQYVNQPVADSSGKGAAFSVTSTTGVNAWFYWDGTAFRKLFVPGDVIGGRTYLSVDGPVSNGSGQFFARGNGANYSALLKLDPVKGPSAILFSGTQASNGVRFGWVHFVLDARGDKVLMDADTDPGGSYATRLAIADSGRLEGLWSAGNGRWFALAGGGLTGSGAVALALFGQDGQYSIRAVNGGSITTLVAPGAAYSGPGGTAPDWNYLPVQQSASRLVVKGAGDTVLEAAGGNVRTLFAASSYPGSEGFQTLGAVATNPAGDVVFTASSGGQSAVGAIRGGRVEVLARANGAFRTQAGTPVSWFDTWNGRYLASNSRGQVAVTGGVNGRSMLFILDGNATAAAVVAGAGLPAPVGGAISSIYQAAIDEGGRVGFLAQVSDGRAVFFLWENGQLRPLAATGDRGPDGFPLVELSNLQAMGNEFAVLARYSNPQSRELRAFDGATSRVLAGERSAIGGAVLTGIFGNQFAASASGEIGLIAYTSDGASLFARRRGGAGFAVWKNTEKGPEGEWLLQPLRMSVSDSGDIFFSALVYLNGRETLALYQASPQ